MFTTNKMSASSFLVQVMTIVSIVNCLLLVLSQAAPTLPISSPSASAPVAAAAALSPPAVTGNHSPVVELMKFEANRQVPESSNVASSASGHHEHNLEPASSSFSQKVKRDSKAKASSAELDTQETGHYLPQAYPSATESDYGYDSGKNSYGKQASDWSLYDQGE
jgi:hypothetical protein